MANHESAKKRNRQNILRNLRNKARKTRISTFLKRVEAAIANGDKAAAMAALREAQSEMFKGVSKGKGVISKNRASRKMSRLSGRIKALEN